VARVQNDVLLNEEEIYSYLSQVAPVPFAPDFQFGEVIAEFIHRHSSYDTIDIIIGPSRIVFRPHRNTFQITEHVKDTFSEISFFKIPGIEEEVDAFGWLLTHSYLGAISKQAQIAGLRARVGNIQIGDASTFSDLFSQPRFNSWCVGEIHVINKRIVPNGRRDNFEVNGHLQNLQGHIAKTAKDVIRICRDKSAIRNRLKSAATLVESAHQTISLIEENKFTILRQYLEMHSSKLLVQLEQIMEASLLSDEERRLVHQRFVVLHERLKATLKGNSRRKDPLAKLGVVKRRAFQDAIEAILNSSLPIAVRAELTEKIIRKSQK
jgi:molecular chaperone HtpG